MIEESRENVFENKAFHDKSIIETPADKRTEPDMNRIDELILKIQNTREYEQKYKNLDNYYGKIRERLKGRDGRLISDMDDCFTDILIMFEEYFYVTGYNDGIRSKGLFERLVSKIKNIM